MNNFYQYQPDTNFSTTKENPLSGGGFGVQPMGSSNGPTPHPHQNGARNPSPQPAWGVGAVGGVGGAGGVGGVGGVGGAGVQTSRNAFNTIGSGNQPRLGGGPDRSRMYTNSKDMLMVLKRGLKDKDIPGVSEGEQQTGIFDPSEFPSLGGPGASVSAVGEGGGPIPPGDGSASVPELYSSGTAYGNSFRIKAPDVNPNIDMRLQTDDFPALSPNANANGRGDIGSGLRGYESNAISDSLEQRLNMTASSTATAFASASTYGGALGKPVTPGAPTRPRVVQPEGTRSGTIGEPKNEDLDAYGMKGFLKVMAPSNPDVALLSLGIDLRTLGLNLNSPEPHLHESFKSPFGDRSASQKGEPEYQIPSCYFTQPNQMQASHFSKLQLETLFYIFYSMPQDVLQTYASLELYEREW
eukprot:CAMPEP_0184742898 /NCGR_PEP_ID=MMETSP0315-20130426/5847_1 /TAXON_ID=101924 /ORGANISM="Rhodosorus marinus, Strain UTEX LB 2760" /LENGTH=411 /DNA_ID=CAMNT_0027213967 /DNA_START=385 /DNA_END=1617 /DNA_ORIENTATION=+